MNKNRRYLWRNITLSLFKKANWLLRDYPLKEISLFVAEIITWIGIDNTANKLMKTIDNFD